MAHIVLAVADNASTWLLARRRSWRRSWRCRPGRKPDAV